MGVYIKDIEMPKSCADCPCSSIFAGYKCMACGKQFDKYPLENRMDWCPLISVPSHGRLIDGDALTYLMGMDEHFPPLEALYLAGVVADAPTIIEAETILENEIKIIDTKRKPNYDPKHRFVTTAEEDE